MSTKDKLIIIDGNAIVHRAYHALPPLTTKDGLMVNAVYGFASMLLRVWKDLKPTHIAVTFDMSGPTFRHEKYKEYKATRVKADQELYDQIPLAHELVAAFGIPIYEKKGYEADDVIGTIAKQVCHPERSEGSLTPRSKRDSSASPQNDNIEVVIVTGDKDTIQLVDKNISVYTLRKGLSDTVTYDPAKVKEVFGFEPRQMIDYKALAGDSSDNIPGVRGIGEKTAVDLVQKFGGIDEIYKKIKILQDYKIKPAVIKKLQEDETGARQSYELAAIDCAVPDLNFKLDDCQIKDFDHEAVVKLFQKFEFVSLLRRVPGMEGENQKLNIKNQKVVKTAGKFRFEEIKNKSDADKLAEEIIRAKQFGARALLEGKDIFSGEFKGLILVVGDNGYFVSSPVILSDSEGSILRLFAEKDIELIGHDLKQLVKALDVYCHFERNEASLRIRSQRDPSPYQSGAQDDSAVQCRLFDTMIASYLLNPGSRAHDAGSVVLKILGKELPAGTGQESLFGVDKKAAAQELRLLMQAASKLRAELKKIDDYGLFGKVEMPLIPVLAQMELNGVAVDKAMLTKLSQEVSEEIKKLTKKIYQESGEEFNIGSPIQLREVLFEKMDLPTQGVKKGKTGYSTDAEELEKLRGLHPIIDDIQNYRELAKLQNTYIDVLPALINKTTGRIHTSFNQAVTATGRLSSSEPNLQNIPIRTELGREVRKAFVSESGNVLISADYSQIELRIVASLAQDKRMMEIFERGQDIHRATAAAINEVPLEKVTKEMRRAAKEVNFGILYGMGAYGLSWRAEIPQARAKEFIEKYFHEFSGVKKYLDETLEFTRKEGYCETLFGRRRYIPELNSANYQLRSAAERMAINHPIQGTAADLIKMAMIEISEKLRDPHLTSPLKGGENRESPLFKEGVGGGLVGQDVRMILQVHDELVFEVKKGLEDEVAKTIKETMESVAKLRVPIWVDVHTGHSWGEMK